MRRLEGVKTFVDSHYQSKYQQSYAYTEPPSTEHSQEKYESGPFDLHEGSLERLGSKAVLASHKRLSTSKKIFYTTIFLTNGNSLSDLF